MNVTYRDVDVDCRADRELLTRWYNEPEVKGLYSRFTDELGASREFTPEDFERPGRIPPPGGPRGNLMILVDGAPVGQATFETDTPKLLTTSAQTAWIALIIGDRRLRGCGLGTRVVAHVEAIAADAGAVRAEVGVFEYNVAALGFFASLGYREFARRPERVWWRGRMWAEIRLLKTL